MRQYSYYKIHKRKTYLKGRCYIKKERKANIGKNTTLLQYCKHSKKLIFFLTIIHILKYSLKFIWLYDVFILNILLQFVDVIWYVNIMF